MYIISFILFSTLNYLCNTNISSIQDTYGMFGLNQKHLESYYLLTSWLYNVNHIFSLKNKKIKIINVFDFEIVLVVIEIASIT